MSNIQNNLIPFEENLFLIGIQELLKQPEDWLTVTLFNFTEDYTRNFEKIDVERLCYSIDYYYKIQNKKTILFTDFNESFESNFFVKVHELIDNLKEKYNYEDSQFIIGSGALPIVENFLAYNKICRLNDWNLYSILFYNTFETRMKSKMHRHEFLNIELDTKKEKKFLFLNGQGRSHRALLLGKFAAMNSLEDFEFSYHEDMTNTVNKYYMFGDEDPRFVEEMKKVFPFVQNVSKKLLTIGTNDFYGQHHISIDDLRLFRRTYLSIIAETVFFKREYLHQKAHMTHLDGIFLTEKTYRAIACRHPFIIASRPYTLKALRDMGYKTFSPYIDESYDNIQDDYDRLQRITDIVKNMSEKNIDYWKDLHENITPIIEYNFQHLLNCEPKIFMSTHHG